MNKFLIIFIICLVSRTLSVNDCVETLDDFLNETKEYDDDNFREYLNLALSVGNVFGGLQAKFMAQIMPKIFDLATKSADEQESTCLINLDSVIEQALITERGSSIATIVQAMEDSINNAVGVSSEITQQEHGHLYANGFMNPTTYCNPFIWNTLTDIATTYRELIPYDFDSNDVSFYSVFVYQPLYATATRLYKIILDLALGCPVTDVRSTDVGYTGETLSHEDFMLNAYTVAIDAMNEVLDLMSKSNELKRLNNLSCTETCSFTGVGSGCSDSTCTCGCFDNVVSGTYNSYSNRNYDIVCTDAGVSDWKVQAEWDCTISDNRRNKKWYEVWLSDYTQECWNNSDHAGECITDDYKTQQIEDAGFNDYVAAIQEIVETYRNEIAEITQVTEGNAIELQDIVEENMANSSDQVVEAAYADQKSYYYVDDGCHKESNGNNDHDDDDIGTYVAESGNQEFHDVRCCSEDGTVCTSYSGGQCSGTKDYAGAKAFCNSIPGNYRLCTAGELLSDICCGTGCSADSKTVWTSTENHYRGFDWIIYYDLGLIDFILLMPGIQMNYSSNRDCESKCAEDEACYGFWQDSLQLDDCDMWMYNAASALDENNFTYEYLNDFKTSTAWKPSKPSIFWKKKLGVVSYHSAFNVSEIDYTFGCNSELNYSERVTVSSSFWSSYDTMVNMCKQTCYEHEDGCVAFQIDRYTLKPGYDYRHDNLGNCNDNINKSLAQMQQECDANDECDGFSMLNGAGWCFKHRLTNGYVAGDHDFYVKNQAYSESYKHVSKYDYYGDNIGSCFDNTNKTLEEMQAECDSNAACLGFSMLDRGDGLLGWCFKSELSDGYDDDDHEFYVKNTFSSYTTAWSGLCMDGTGNGNTGYREYNSGTKDNCEYECSVNPNCTGYAYHNDATTCKLYDETTFVEWTASTYLKYTCYQKDQEETFTGKYYHHCDLLFLSDLANRSASYQGTVLEPPIYGGSCSDGTVSEIYVRKGCEHCTSDACASCDLLLHESHESN